MKIYTSYFGNAKALDRNGIMIVSIACWQPRFLSIPCIMRNVAPTPWMVKKASHQQYLDAYRQILSQINPHDFISNLERISGGRDVALCCYEKPGDFCHRHLLAEYLTKHTGIEVKEFDTTPPAPKKPEKIEPPSLFDDF